MLEVVIDARNLFLLVQVTGVLEILDLAAVHAVGEGLLDLLRAVPSGMAFSHFGPLSAWPFQILATGDVPGGGRGFGGVDLAVEVARLEGLASHRVSVEELKRGIDGVPLGLLFEDHADCDVLPVGGTSDVVLHDAERRHARRHLRLIAVGRAGSVGPSLSVLHPTSHSGAAANEKTKAQRKGETAGLHQDLLGSVTGSQVAVEMARCKVARQKAMDVRRRRGRMER